MLNEFVYCSRLFYYEHVEGVFVESADTVKGAAVHARVDKGKGALPQATSASGEGDEAKPVADGDEIHSRSVMLGSERLGVVAKMDLVEATLSRDGSVAAVQRVDYKVGAPREGVVGLELWDADKMQLGLQCLVLPDNGYACDTGIIYYRKTKQRVPLELTLELEAWVISKIAEARVCAKGLIPPLDVMEEFRPLIAESAVLTAINNRFVSTRDFVSAGRAVNLNVAGRKQFFQCFEQRMNSLITHPVFDCKVSYRRALELQFRILARVLTGEIPEYVPFLTR